MPKGVYIRTEEFRKEQSEARLGCVQSPESNEKRRKAATTPEALERNRLVHTGIYDGSDNPNWKGGKSFEEYPPEFNEPLRLRIREQDGNVCQCCSRTRLEEGKELCVHHIDYNKQNCNENNLITLCHSCNTKANGNTLHEYIHMRVFQQKLGEAA